jgi:hypothetical protein
MPAVAYACSYCSSLSATLYSSCRACLFQFETLHYPWIPSYFLRENEAESDSLSSLSERADFLHPPALKRNCPL